MIYCLETLQLIIGWIDSNEQHHMTTICKIGTFITRSELNKLASHGNPLIQRYYNAGKERMTEFRWIQKMLHIFAGIVDDQLIDKNTAMQSDHVISVRSYI